MNTDVTLASPTRTIIVECKYYRRTLQSFHGSDSIRSGHLYQLHAYLTNLRAHSDLESRIQGILVYPQIDQALDVHFRLQDIPVRVYTIDLTRSWQHIKESLLSLLSPKTC